MWPFLLINSGGDYINDKLLTVSNRIINVIEQVSVETKTARKFNWPGSLLKEYPLILTKGSNFLTNQNMSDLLSVVKIYYLRRPASAIFCLSFHWVELLS